MHWSLSVESCLDPEFWFTLIYLLNSVQVYISRISRYVVLKTKFWQKNWIGTKTPPFQRQRMCIGASLCWISCRLRILIYWSKYIFLSFFGWLSKKYFCVKLQRRNRYFSRKFRFIAGILNLEFPFVADSRNICSNGSLMNICVRNIPMFLPCQKCGIITQNSQQHLRESRCW